MTRNVSRVGADMAMTFYDRALVVVAHARSNDAVDVIRILCGIAAAADLVGDEARHDRTVQIAADLLADARLKRRRQAD